MIEKNNKDSENLILDNENIDKIEIRNIDFDKGNKNEMNIIKNEKHEYLDFRGSFSVLKKFLQNQNIIFLCKNCNSFICSNYSLEDVLVFKNNSLNLIFNLETLFEQAEKNYNSDLSFKQIADFFKDNNIIIDSNIEFTQEENTSLDFIWHKLICINCQNIIGKYTIGVPLNLIKFKEKIFLSDKEITAIKREIGCFPERIYFDDFLTNDKIYQNILNETIKQTDNTKDILLNFHSFTSVLKYLKDIKKYINISIEDFESLKEYYDYLEYLKNKV